MMIFYETRGGVSAVNSKYVVDVFVKGCCVKASVVDANGTVSSLMYPEGGAVESFRYVTLCVFDTEDEAVEAMQEFYVAYKNGVRAFWFGYVVEHGGKKPNEFVVPF